MAAFTHVELLLADASMDAEARRETLSSVREALHRIRDIVRRIGDLREIRTKSYATGVQMVDLDDVGPASAVRRGQAMVLVSDEDLARIVSLLLKHAGFEVVRAGDGPDLGRRAATGQTSLVVAQGGTDAAGAHPLGGFVPPASRSYRVVALVSGDGTGAVAAGADHVVELPFDPGAFTAEVIELTGGR
jgi:hypothetical protein